MLQHKILVAEDEQDILELIRYTLNKEGYKVIVAANGIKAVELAQSQKPNLILMDVMMPLMDGMEACREIKKNEETKNIPVIFLTARSEEFAELAGFEAGAEDYIAKPIRQRILLSRIKSIIRRINPENHNEPSEPLSFQNLVIDRQQFLVKFGDKKLHLPKKEFELLAFLASKPGRVFTREEILEHVWGNEVLVVDRTIDVHIRKIREKLNDQYIYTVKGVGYKFEE